MNALILYFGLALVTGTAIAAEAQSIGQEWSNERMGKIVERAKTNPDALWELKDAPLEQVYQPLRHFWLTHASMVGSRLEMKKQGREAEYLKAQAEYGLDPEYSAKVFPIARDVMLAHPDYEAYLSGKLQHLTQVLLRVETDMDFRRSSRDFGGADTDYSRYLDMAYLTPGDMAFRMVGPCILGAYYPMRDYGDYYMSSPAAIARGKLARLAKERFGEEIPEDIEAARQWWRANEHRFAAKPPPQPPSPPSTALLSSPPDASAPAAAPIPRAKVSQRVRFSFCVAVGVVVLVSLVIWRARRKS